MEMSFSNKAMNGNIRCVNCWEKPSKALSEEQVKRIQKERERVNRCLNCTQPYCNGQCSVWGSRQTSDKRRRNRE